MKLILRAAICVLLPAMLVTPALTQTASIESPAIDPDLFRPGEVTRSQHDFARWRVVCDEVRKLKQKFCSLRSFGYGAGDQPLVGIVISTSDNGRPAALITLPFGTTLRQHVTLVSGGIKGRVQPVKLEMTPALCVEDGCKIIWALNNNDIMTLRNGADFELSFLAATHEPQGDPYFRQKQAVLTIARIYGQGFNEAVLDSTK